MLNQAGKLIGLSQSFGERDHFVKCVFHIFREPLKYWRIKNTRCNGHEPYAVFRKLTGNGKGHSNNAGLGSAVCGLTDLPVKGCNRGRIDHNPLFIIIVSLVFHHLLCREPDNIHGANQVDLHNFIEMVHGHGSFLAEHLARDSHPRAIDRNVNRAKGLDGLVYCRLDISFIGDIGHAKNHISP